MVRYDGRDRLSISDLSIDSQRLQPKRVSHELRVENRPSPVGRLKLVASDAGLAAVLWENDDPHRVRLGPMVEGLAHPILVETGRQLAAYFAGNLKAFNIPLDIKGTEFQRRVWAALLTIPFGETRSYGQIARQIGHPAAVRAVGAANGRNPISIVATVWWELPAR